jgi:hypothetical protein
MEPTMHPDGTRLLADTEIGDEWLASSQAYRTALLLSLPGMLAIFFLPMTQFIVFTIALCASMLLIANRKLAIKRMDTGRISLARGHPWHDEETTGETTVSVLDMDGVWQALPNGARIFAMKDPILGKTLLRNGDSDGKVLVRMLEAGSAFITLLNMAQALAQAQDLEIGAADPFEVARDRENTAEGMLEREWENTDEGGIEYEPGALIRALKRKTSGE